MILLAPRAGRSAKLFLPQLPLFAESGQKKSSSNGIQLHEVWGISPFPLTGLAVKHLICKGIARDVKDTKGRLKCNWPISFKKSVVFFMAPGR